MADIIVHIGLPKTASTALQEHFFEPLNGDTWSYLGVSQPRSSKQDETFHKLITFVSSPISPSEESRIDLQKELAERLQTQSPLLISEEGISVDSAISWQNKLQRLASVTDVFDTQILVTIRDPKQAAHSLYVENHRALSKSAPTFREFLVTNQAQIFNYEFLVRYLSELFNENQVAVVPYELLEIEGAFVSAVSKALGITVRPMSLPRENVASKTPHGKKTRALSMLELASSSIGHGRLRTLLDQKTVKGATARLRSFLRGTKIPGSSYSVPPITEEDRELIGDQLRSSNEWANLRFGCRY